MKVTKRFLIRQILRDRGRWEGNWYVRWPKRMCLVFKAVISALRATCSFDYLDKGYEMAHWGCRDVSGYWDPEDFACNRIYVHMGLRNWFIRVVDD